MRLFHFKMAQMTSAMFVQTDPTFAYALAAFNDLGRANEIGNFQTNRVTNAFVCNRNQGNNWRSPFDFSRSVAVVMRSFFIAALNLDINAHVAYPVNVVTIPNRQNLIVRQATLPNFPQVTTVNLEGTLMYERYDQMFPHYVVEREVTQQGVNAMTRGCIIIVPLPMGGGWDVYQITSTIVVNRNGTAYVSSGTVICIGGHVNAGVNVERWTRLLELSFPQEQEILEDYGEEEEDEEDA